MKADIHPDYFETTVRCACGNEVQVHSTIRDIHIDICSNCHPFYTGKLKFIDTAGRIEKFQTKFSSGSYASVAAGKPKKKPKPRKEEL